MKTNRTGSLSKADGKVDVDNNETCCQSAKNWCWRNIIHIVLLTMAVGAVGGAIIGSLDSCNSTLENITVTTEVVRSVNVTRNVTTYRNVTQNVTVKVVTPLSAYILIDASMSMVWAESGASTCNAAACNGVYVITNQTTQGKSDNTTQFSCFTWDAPFDCWPTPSAVTIDSWAYDPNAQGDRFDKAKLAFDEILRKLDTALNNGTSNKFRSGILQWAHDDRGVVVESHLTSDTNTTLEANQNMVINGAGNTCWAPGLCQCYSQLKNDTESVNATKMCILMTDGALYPNGCKMDVARYAADTGDGVFEKDNTRISTEFCDELYNDWSTEQGTTNEMTHRDVSTFVKSKGISIYGIGVGLSSGSNSARDVFDTASCSDYTFGTNDADCPYFANVADFAALTAKSEEIASYQSALATSEETRTESSTEEQTVEETETVTVTDTETELREESVSICSLDFLYALAAFGPFLAYLMYRMCTILGTRKANKKKLLKMIRDGTMTTRWGPAGAATRILLPNNRPSDIDFAISYALFSCCPCLLPVQRSEMDLFLQETLAL